MKTNKFLVTAIVMLLVTASFAGSKDLAIVKVTGVNTFKLVLNELPGDVDIQLRDQYGHVLYQEHISASDYAKLYNVKDLANGKYFLELESEIKLQLIPFSIRGGQVYLKGSEQREFFKPVVHQKEEILTVNQFTPGLSPMKVAFYDNDLRLIIKDKLQGAMTLGKRYDLSNLGPGTYKLYLISEGRSYSHTLLVR